MKLKHLLLVLLTLVLTISFLVYYAFNIEPKRITLKKYQIKEDSIPESLHGFKIGFISDLDIQNEASLKQLDKTVKKINQSDIDLLVFGGDLFYKEVIYRDEVMSLLKSIKVTNGKFAILGEKDYTFLADVESVLFDADFELLKNESRRITTNNASFTILGLESEMPIEPILSESMLNDYKIALIHAPDTFASMMNEQINIQISGHSYGGVIAIPLLHLIAIENANNYYNGFYKANDKTLYVSNGIGMRDYDYRFLAPPQVLIVELAPEVLPPIKVEEDKPVDQTTENNEANNPENSDNSVPENTETQDQNNQESQDVEPSP